MGDRPLDWFNYSMNVDDIKKISTLGLAHLGDAVYELLVRVWLCDSGKATSRGLHSAAVAHVSASAQAGSTEKLMPVLTEEELAVFRRGRNANPHTIPKNASPENYGLATALEALFGWLYLMGRRERINELFSLIMEDKDNAT